MSRIGRTPITILEGVEVKVDNNKVIVKGPKGMLEFDIPQGIEVKFENNTVTVHRVNDKPKYKMLHGTVRSIIENMIIGVKDGYVKELEIQGVGYKVEKQGNKLALYLGYNHPLYVEIPDYVEVEVPSQTDIIIKGIDKQKVGQFAAYIRQLKKPDVYKGKGIRYKGEQVRKKEVKTTV